jgi:NADPH:quinone reductase-like Zn-dependent oxidoreductase
MRAIRFDSYGGPEVLHPAEAEPPEPKPGKVRIRVRASGVNPFDGKVRSGAMQAMIKRSLPAIPGIELAGVVDALGEGATGFAVGDAVLGRSTTGSYAEYAIAGEIVAKPEGLAWEAAAALPVAVGTAQRILQELKVGPGETLLINGGAGAVGTMAVQLAVARGAKVIATASAANQEYLASLGATPTTYGDGLVERVRALSPGGVDAVFDVAGKGALPASIELRGGTDRIVTIADPAAQDLGVAFISAGTSATSAAELAEAAEQAASGKLVVTLGAVLPLAEAAEAHRIIDAGHVRGKVVLTVD